MKPLSIHPFSAVAGAGLLGLVLLASGAVQVPVRSIPTHRHNPVRVAGIPTPQQMMVIKEGTSFVVPEDKILVVTA